MAEKKASGSIWPIILVVLLIVGVSVFGYFRGGSEKIGGINKEEVERIVAEYIKNHPDDIVASVQEMQVRKSQEEANKAQENITDKKEELEQDAESPTVGNTKGDVTVVEFFDYNCGFCKRVQPSIVKLLNEDKNVRFIMKELPILSPVSEIAARAALASYAIAPDKYLDVYNALMAARLTDKDSVMEVIKQVGLDVDKISAEMDSSKISAHLAKNQELASSIGIRGTPAFVINGKMIPGAISFEQMQTEVAEARKK